VIYSSKKLLLFLGKVLILIVKTSLNLSNQHSIYQSIQQTSQNSIQHKIPSHLTNQSFQLINQPIPVTQRNYPYFNQYNQIINIYNFPYGFLPPSQSSLPLYQNSTYFQSTHDDDTDTTVESNDDTDLFPQ